MTLVAGFIPFIVSLLLAAAPVAALETDLPLAARFPAGSIQNSERALEALDAVTQCNFDVANGRHHGFQFFRLQAGLVVGAGQVAV